MIDTRLRCAALAFFAVSTSAYGGAATAVPSVTIGSVDGVVTLDASEASVDSVLASLGKTYGFKIERIGQVASAKVWGHYTGSLTSVLSRVLESESHMIVHSNASKGGIDKIVLYGESYERPADTRSIPPDRQQPPAQSQAASRSGFTGGPRPLAREIIPPAQPVASQARVGAN